MTSRGGRRCRRLLLGCVAGSLILVEGKTKQVEYWQNCASRGHCDKLYEFRDRAIHEAPEGSPKGHFQPLGHPDFLDAWDGEIDTFLEPPSPEIFWTKYHALRRPFIVRGGASRSAAMNWTDEYVIQHFGDEVAKTEWRNEDRLTDYCGHTIKGKFILCPKDTIPYVESRTSIRNFIQKSTADPSWAKYIISQMPDGMGKDFDVPAFFNCGKRQKGDHVKDKPWMTPMYENNFWYLRTPPGYAGTSTIHFDMNHQIMCVFAGKKEWIMWDLQTEEKKIPMWNSYYKSPLKGSTQGSDDSPIDGERVDLKRWPEFANARWVNTTMEKGDCLFTPANLLHYVRSWSDDPADPRIVALMTMFDRGVKYDPTYCHDTPSHMKLSEFDTMWGEFPGSMRVPRCMNHIKMGYPNWKQTLAELAKSEVDKKAFTRFWSQVSEGGYPKKLITKAWETFTTKERLVGSWAERVFNSTAVRDLCKDVLCGVEGSNGPERKLQDGESWDARNEYSLADKESAKKAYTDETHEL
eukprot:TRINITY_DN10822_c0_g1_i1.p1 TRINITY_DN10822_c0_g1~~TRINITY_DN10822_c0_g1_i1.p1  ORF type:complete len:522 (-),score=77.42 TRINITY_DN10822_c0_g1_i1:61-1626(-)